MRIAAIIGAIVLGAALILLGAFGARWLNPASDAAVETVPAPDADTSTTIAPSALDRNTVRELLAVLDSQRRSQILESQEEFERFVAQETLNQAVLKAAYANGADQNEQIKVLMQRAGHKVLVDAYLNQVVRLNLDQDFPNDEQVREAYDKNQQAFRVPQRMHLWQIFIPLAADAEDKAYKSAWALADKVSADLRAGKADFDAMARQHSAHPASRMNDGYMGLIKISDLLPPIASAAQALKVNGISEPIATESGLHILKRGEFVDEEVIDFETIKGNVRERLRREAALKVRQAVVEKIAEEYPVEAPGEQVEQWRTTLLEAQSASGNVAAASE